MKKIIILIAFSLFAFLSAQSYKSGVELEARVIGASIGEGKAFDHGSGNKTIKKFKISYTGSVDNISATVVFSKTKFNKASLTVSDLFDGLLTVKFYDIGYGKGKDNSILPDTGMHGISLTFKPMEILSLYIAYGIRNTTFKGVLKGANIAAAAGNATARATSAAFTNSVTAISSQIVHGSGSSVDGDDIKSDIHGISLGVDVATELVDVGVYAGAMIFDNAPQWVKADTTAKAATDALLKNNVNSILESQSIALVNAGLAVDALKFFTPGLLKIDVGAAFLGAYTYDIFRSSSLLTDGAEAKAKSDINMVAILHGGLDNIAETSFGVDYYLHFALDTATKEQTLGDLNDDDEYFKNMVKVVITPKYTLSQFTFSLPIEFTMLGNEQAYVLGYYGTKATPDITKTKNKDNYKEISPMSMSLTPTVTWNVATGMAVDFYADYDLNDLGSLVKNVGGDSSTGAVDDYKSDLDVGMKVKVAFNVGADE